MNFVLLGLPVAFLVVSVLLSIRAVKKGKKKSRALAIQMFSFLAVCIVTFAVPAFASATTTNTAPAQPTTSDVAAAGTAAATASAKGMGLLAAALVTGIAGIAGAIAVAAAAPAAIGATSEDPKVFGKALIFVALGEGIALYGLLVSILILNKI